MSHYKETQREIRKLAEPLVVQSWNDVQKNIGKFNNYFQGNFIIVDNNDAKEDVFTAVFKRIKKLANRKIQNKRAQQWINMELQKKAEGERGTLGTGRIARPEDELQTLRELQIFEKVVYNNFSDVHKTQGNYASGLTLNYYK